MKRLRLFSLPWMRVSHTHRIAIYVPKDGCVFPRISLNWPQVTHCQIYSSYITTSDEISTFHTACVIISTKGICVWTKSWVSEDTTQYFYSAVICFSGKYMFPMHAAEKCQCYVSPERFHWISVLRHDSSLIANSLQINSARVSYNYIAITVSMDWSS